MNKTTRIEKKGKTLAKELYYYIFHTNAGWAGVLGSETGLLRVTLPQPLRQEVYQRLGVGRGQATRSASYFKDLPERLKAYFAGHKVDFPDRLDLRGTTDFQRRVWEAARLIPRGETRSYAWIARQINTPDAFRAAGQALARNPLPVIIPCHRVVASDGRLGGFSGGLDMKKFLLRLESGNP